MVRLGEEEREKVNDGLLHLISSLTWLEDELGLSETAGRGCKGTCTMLCEPLVCARRWNMAHFSDMSFPWPRTRCYAVFWSILDLERP